MVDSLPELRSQVYPQRVLTDRHAYHQFLLGLEGSLELEVSGKPVHVTPGTLTPIATGEEHHYLAFGANQGLTLNLPVEWCETLALDGLVEGSPRRLSPGLVAQATLLSAQRPMELASWLVAALGNASLRVRPPRLRLIRLLPAVAANLAYPWRVRDMAARCHLAEAAFARQFRALTGQTPHAWLVAKRLEQACRMMTDRQASLTEIALACGFGDAAHFSRVFREHYHCSPRDWRRNAG